VYDPVATLQQDDEVLYVARVGMNASRQFMILTAEARLHGRVNRFLSDVAWSARAHRWHLAEPELAGEDARPARTLVRLLTRP